MTHSNESRARRRWRAALPLAAALLLAGCGGDEQLARTGGGGTGLATTIGTVTGFGSVIVDGEAWDDRRARVELERSPALGWMPTESRLGQRVRIEYATRGSADRVHVEPEVIGRVSGIGAAADPPQFKLAGQTVRVNLDPAAGPRTLFVGVAGVAALQLDDAVEVHATSRFDTDLNRYVLTASRVEKLASLPAGLVRVSGVVESSNAAARSFRLGELTVTAGASTVMVPAGRAPADGQRVIVWSDDPLGSGTSGPTLAADFIRLVERSAGGGARSEISGTIGRLDPDTLRFDVGGVAVNGRAAIIVPASQSLASGRYAIVSGSFDAAGVLQAVQVRLRPADALEVQLNGTITDFASVANFKVRDQSVNATGVTALPGCPQSGLRDGLYVEIEGRLGSADGRVQALRVRCDANPSGRVLTRVGLATVVDVPARRFTLTAGTLVRSVTWTDTTLFAGLTIETLAGRSVSVEGYEGHDSAASFIATKIRPRD